MNVARASTPAGALSNGRPNKGEQPDEGYDIRISADGTWFHEGAPIGRMTLVKLFASVLSRDEAGDFWLVTPAERGRITVADAPFVAVGFRAEGAGSGQRLIFRTNLDQEIAAGPNHPIRVAEAALSGEPRPYILVRDRLEARIARAIFYDLVQIAVERTTPDGVELGIWSERILFPAGNDPIRLTAADIRHRFQTAPPGGVRGAYLLRGDHDLNPGLVMAAEPRAAAVLVPLVDHPDGLTVLLTQRTTNLSSHAGQISFPGGGIEAGDADAVAAALRETEEETGIAAGYIEPVGQLDRYATRTGYMITPVVAILHASFNLILQAREVADAFEVPLAFFLDPANRRLQPAEYQGTTRYFYVYPYGDRYIWGATAGMLSNLAEVLADAGH